MTTGGAAPRVFSIPASEDFLTCLTDALLGGTLIDNFPRADDPFSLASATIFLPNRRACRVLSAQLKDRGLVLMPRLRPLGDIDESDLLFADGDAELVELPPAIAPLERQLILSRLILAWAEASRVEGREVLTPASPADAIYLAGALGQMLDMVANEGLSFSAIRDLPPLDLQEHWQVAFRFLDIAVTAWPDYLKAAHREEPVVRRQRLLQAEAARLMQNPNTPVIAAGSTASVPVTAEFLTALARHPSGAVVLPGLDRALDEADWALIADAPVPSHPQMAMAQFLKKLGLPRDNVRHLGAPMTAREALLSDAMRPAETTEKWAGKTHCETQALDGVALVEAAHPHEEALAIACLMRETLEDKDRTVALVTPDRQLARRVAAELKRFDIDIDDSAGAPLTDTPGGIFARLVAAVALSQAACEDVLSLLKHPLCRLGASAADAQRANSALERLAFRGLNPPKGSGAILDWLDRKPPTEAARSVTESDRTAAADRLNAFCAAIEGLETCFKTEGPQPLGALVACHAKAIDAFARADTADGAAMMRRSFGGDVLADFLNALQAAGDDHITCPAADYPAVFTALAAGIPVRRVTRGAGAAHIYGLLEARLMRHDRLILGGLNEGTWPPTGHNDPWLSRGMRGALNLPAPEQRIGRAAHDVVQGLGTQDVWLTRSNRSGGNPSVPSRFVQRLNAVAGEHAMQAVKERGARALRFARLLDRGKARPEPVARPAPSPPVRARPRRLSVTQIETLLRDPYAIYARHILGLRPFEALSEVFGAAERGTLIHAVLADYAAAIDAGTPVDEQTLHAIAHRAFVPFLDRPDVQTYWWPRFEDVIPELAAFERERRAQGAQVFAEQDGMFELALPGGAFALTARADRIEQHQGRIALVDYKTGHLPDVQDITLSYALQLNLQAAMVDQSAFPNVRGKVDEAFYLGITREGIESRPGEGKRSPDPDKALRGVMDVLRAFDDGAPYLSKADSTHALAYNPYLHLARLREWGIAGSADESAA